MAAPPKAAAKAPPAPAPAPPAPPAPAPDALASQLGAGQSFFSDPGVLTKFAAVSAVTGAAAFLFFRYRVAKPNEFLAWTGPGISGVKVRGTLQLCASEPSSGLHRHS